MTAERCPRCMWPVRVCLCAAIPRIETQTRVVIVRHHRERVRSSNSGRLAHLALVNSELVDHDGPAGPARPPALDESAWLVFPAGEPMARAPSPPPGQLILLDATWSQARRMYRKLAWLRGRPILRLPDTPVPAARLRNSPGRGMVSTLEAIAQALRLIEGDGPADQLDALFAVAVARAAASGRLTPPAELPP